jgi:Ca-activated chloride channel family protein
MHPTNPNRPYWFGGTEIGKALLACREVLVSREKGDRMIILVSDGWSADLEGDRPEQIARRLSGDGIVVYPIHIGEGEVPPPISTIASLTGGEVFHPGDPQGLATVFGRIDRMEQARLERSLGETLDDFAPFCLAGLSLLGMYIFSLFGLRYTPW